ncbi:hypothetical protein FA366_13400 [Pseudomonas aeruginosa]|uniref:hypothetical protein n=1 Tax=Pseudomonas aeruginosa TaxID=287 RepID=UPI002E2A2B9C|nr:hypothetical protein [Pseudomonas aeruginosa]MCO2328540.1 hypothetical protein [Pseudomonas aeruginosa]MCS8060943.1 hypothetical protein [Pseudomonas aeruginosa]HBP4228584.1 hypothetical protein [Pseudomonas aeruginosa]HBP4649055.1 hypothetical protein [Pseudomonas aeruginosa]HBP4752286.1 hypothetical protein [Pseudomonas aeruginosa]
MKYTNPPAPKIGFDRYIALDWASAALQVRAGLADLDDLNALLESAGLSVAARKKTRTVLNRLWLEPRAELASFAERGLAIYKANPSIPAAALTWGMAIATYPFFGKVAELVGRLSALQGDCASTEVHRRMSEVYGEREGTYRMTNMVLQSQANWGAIERVENGKRLVRMHPVVLNNEQVVAWLIEAALRYVGKSLSVPALSSLAVLYPFILDQPLGYLASKSPNLIIHTQGPANQVVGLKTHE